MEYIEIYLLDIICLHFQPKNKLLPLLQHGKELLPVNETVPVLVLLWDHDLDLLLRPRVPHHHHHPHQLLSVNKTRNKCCILTTHLFSSIMCYPSLFVSNTLKAASMSSVPSVSAVLLFISITNSCSEMMKRRKSMNNFNNLKINCPWSILIHLPIKKNKW